MSTVRFYLIMNISYFPPRIHVTSECTSLLRPKSRSNELPMIKSFLPVRGIEYGLRIFWVETSSFTYFSKTIDCCFLNVDSFLRHYGDVIISAMGSQITSLTIVCSTLYSGADQSKHQSSASLAFARGIHRWPVNSPHKGPVTRKMFPFDDVIMVTLLSTNICTISDSCWRVWCMVDISLGTLLHVTYCTHASPPTHFYPRPVLAFGYCRCLRLCVCVCLSVCLSITCLSAR